MTNRNFNRFLAAGLSAAALIAVGCSDSGSGPKALDCHSDPITPLPENFSATGYWTLNDDLQGAFPAGEDGAVDSIALAQHYCEYGSAEGRPFGEDPVYASSEESSSESNGGNSNGASETGNSGEGTTSSSEEEEACERTLMPDHYFKFETGYVGYSGKPMVLGWQPSAEDFRQGEWFLPEGYDCALAVQVDGAPDSYNLNVVEAWLGENIDSVRVEKVTFPGGSKPVQGSSSSAAKPSSASQQTESCNGYTAWDDVASWLEYENNGSDKLYSFNGGLYKCTGAKHYSYCAWSPDIEYSDWVFIRNCDGSATPSSSSKKVSSSSSSSRPSSSSSKPSSSSSKPSSSSQGGNAEHCILNWFHESDFNSYFPNRHQNYTWSAFKEALKKVPNFVCSTAGSDVNRQKQEVAAVFAHWQQEVAALRYIEEICGTQGTCLNSYNSDWSGGSYPPVAGKSYHGRGAKQISWPGNYGQFSEFYYGNKQTLLSNPEKVMNEGILAFASSFWFWLDRGCGSSFWSTGFGATTNIINGGLECGGNYGGAARNRETYYGQYLSRLGVSDSRSKSAGCGGW